MRPSFFGQPQHGLALPPTWAHRCPAVGSIVPYLHRAFIGTAVWFTWLASAAAQSLPTEYPAQQSPRGAREPAVGQMISSGQPNAHNNHNNAPATTPNQAAASAPTLRPTMSPDAWTSQAPGHRSAQPENNPNASPEGIQPSGLPPRELKTQSSSLPPLPAPPQSASISQPRSGSPVVLASATQEAAAPQKTKVRVPLKQAGDEADALPTPSNSSSTLQMLLSIGSSLLIVIGLFLGLAWFYRKTLNTSLSGGLPKQVVQVLGRTPIATRQQLVLVRFGSKLVLVSLVQGEARTISEITDPLEVDQLAGLCESAQAGSISSSFRSILHQGGAV